VKRPTQSCQSRCLKLILTYQDFVKAALIEGNRGGVLSKENTCFAMGTPEGPINLTEALKLDTVAEEIFFTDGEWRTHGGWVL
jgi:hypothetical protein